MTAQTDERYPIDVLYDGCLSASIYRSIDRRGVFYAVEFNRTGQHQGKAAVTKVFRHKHLLHVAHLAKRAYDRITFLRSVGTIVTPTIH